MMCALFDTETLMKVHDNNLYREALEQGITHKAPSEKHLTGL